MFSRFVERYIMCCVSFPQGLYENFLSMRVRDPNLQSVCDALDWLSFSDRLNQVILHGQNFSLMRYLPFLSVKLHFLFAHTHVPRISYPHSQHEVPINCMNIYVAECIKQVFDVKNRLLC